MATKIISLGDESWLTAERLRNSNVVEDHAGGHHSHWIPTCRRERRLCDCGLSMYVFGDSALLGLSHSVYQGLSRLFKSCIYI